MSILSLSGKLLTALIVMAALGVAVLAQSAESIAIGETQRGAVTPENIAPTYFFDAREGQTVTIRLNILTPGFTPLALIADSDNALIGSISSAPVVASLTHTRPLTVGTPAAGAPGNDDTHLSTATPSPSAGMARKSPLDLLVW